MLRRERAGTSSGPLAPPQYANVIVRSCDLYLNPIQPGGGGSI